MYMGKDKFENELLIKYGWPEDVWFHVDDLSSAHVYLRMKPEMILDDIPAEALLDCCSLVKANSIVGCKVGYMTFFLRDVKSFFLLLFEHITKLTDQKNVGFRLVLGNKQSSVYVVYTRWKNLKKTADMVDGQVGFHRPDNVKRIQVEKNNTIVRQLEKSKIETSSDDLYEQQQHHLQQLQAQQKASYKQKQIAEKEAQRIAKQEAIAQKELKSYKHMLLEENMKSNQNVKSSVDTSAAEEYEDDFF
jgi:hypothetical protein